MRPVFSRRTYTVLIALMLATTGCATRKKEAIWTPLPPVSWSDIAPSQVVPAANGHRLQLTEPTRGLFPASMAVTRLAVDQGDGQRQPTLFTDPRNEFLQWNKSFDDKLALSEVFPIGARDLGGHDAQPQHILAAFRALDARIGLIYAVNDISQLESEVLGVLYDVNTGQPLASVHARETSVTPPEDETPYQRVNLWKWDARALARTQFEKSLRACVLELISRDEPAMIETPEGWKHVAPTRAVDWPPRTPPTHP